MDWLFTDSINTNHYTTYGGGAVLPRVSSLLVTFESALTQAVGRIESRASKCDKTVPECVESNMAPRVASDLLK